MAAIGTVVALTLLDHPIQQPSSFMPDYLIVQNQNISIAVNQEIGIKLAPTMNNLRASIIEYPSHGSLALNSNHTTYVYYSPNLNFTGYDRFTFKLRWQHR